MVRARAFHQCDLGSIPGPGVLCGLSLLLVFYCASRGFSPATPGFPSPQKPTFPNSNSIWNAWTFLNEFLWTPWCSVVKQTTFTLHFFYSTFTSPSKTNKYVLHSSYDHCLKCLRQFEFYTNTIVSTFLTLGYEMEQTSASPIMLVLALSLYFNVVLDEERLETSYFSWSHHVFAIHNPFTLLLHA